MCAYLFFFYQFLKLLKLNNKCTKKVVGELVDMEITERRCSNKKSYVYKPVYRYWYDYHWYTSKSDLEMVHIKKDKPSYRIGEKRAIYICPEIPELCVQSRLGGDNGSQDMSIILGEYGATLCLILFLGWCGIFCV